MELDSDCLSNRQIFKMATENSARLIGFGRELGRLEPGRLADMVLLDYEAMTYPFTDISHDPVDVLMYRGHGSHVDTVIINGKVVLQNRQVLGVNESDIVTRLASGAAKPRSEEQLQFKNAIDKLKRNVVDYFQGWPDMIEFDPFYVMNSRTDGLK
jgi:adenine deaminase